MDVRSTSQSCYKKPTDHGQPAGKKPEWWFFSLIFFFWWCFFFFFFRRVVIIVVLSLCAAGAQRGVYICTTTRGGGLTRERAGRPHGRGKTGLSSTPRFLLRHSTPPPACPPFLPRGLQEPTHARSHSSAFPDSHSQCRPVLQSPAPSVQLTSCLTCLFCVFPSFPHEQSIMFC